MNLSPDILHYKSPVEMAAMARRHNTIGHDDVKKVSDQLKSMIKIKPKLGIICGSGLGGLADQLDQDTKQVIPYDDVDGFPQCTVPGHAGNLVFGVLSGCPTVCMQGRFHLYEGHPPWIVTMPIRVMKLLGIEILIVTNAAGGMNPDYKRGDIMIINDHINIAGMSGHNPLMGPNADSFGPRFPPMTVAYDKELRILARKIAQECGFNDFVKEGVYVHITGPNYETPSECRYLRLCGADAVGMSTAPEVVVARHAGIRVLGFSLVTNKVIYDINSDEAPPSHQEVMETADKRAKSMQALVAAIVKEIKF